MKNFTYYEAEKNLKQGGSDLDIFTIDLENLTTAKELSKKLDISESTANNWIAGRTDISKLGEQAIEYQLMLDLISAYNRIPKSNIVVKKQDIYEIYSKNKDGKYELLATTADPKLARVIEEINKVYEMLGMSEDFISTEIQTREGSGYSYDELKGYKTDLANLCDLIHYIQYGITLSEKMENYTRERMKEIGDIIRNNKNKAPSSYQNDFSDFEKYCEQKYGKDTILYNLIINLLKKIKAYFVLVQKDTKWVSDGEYKNFIAIKAQNKSMCIFIKDKSRKLKATTFQIKDDRTPYIRFNIEKMEQLEEAATIINASLKNV